MMKHIRADVPVQSEVSNVEQDCIDKKNNSQLLLRFIEKRKGEFRIRYESANPHILFLLSGCVKLTDKTLSCKYILHGQCLFLPRHEPVDLLAMENTRFVLLLFSRQTFIERRKEFDVKNIGPIEYCANPVMDIAPLILNFLENLPRTQDIFYNDNYHRIKAQEVHEVARSCYSDRQRAWFCQSIIRPEDDFKAFVEVNYSKVRNVPELAELADMCETTFRSKFQEIFGETVHAWMMEQKASKMTELILDGEDKIKPLMSLLGFKHKSSFIRFCNRWMGGNPSIVIAQIIKKRV